MPVAFVTQHYQGSQANITSGVIPVTGAIPGNLLVLWAASRTASNAPVTDLTGNWTKYHSDTGSSGYIEVFARAASGDSSDDISLQFSDTNQSNLVACNEFSGVQVPLTENGASAYISGAYSPGTGISAAFTPGSSAPTALFTIIQNQNCGNWAATENGYSIDSGFTIVGVPPRQSDGAWAGWKHGAHSAFGRSESTSPVSPLWTGDGTGSNLQTSTNVFSFLETATGPPPGEDMDASVSGAASILATLSPVGLFNAAVSGAASIAATLSRVALLGASISGTAAVAGTLETFPVQPGAEMQAAVTGDASVLATLLASGGLGGALDGAASVTATLSPAPGFAADVVGQASVDATLSGVPSLAASVAAGATVDATLAGAFGLSGILAGNSFAILEAPSQFRPRFAMTIDLSPLFEENEFSFTTTWNDQVTFLSILTDFYAESIGGINIAGTDPILIAEHSLIPQVREGDSIKIEDWEWVVREVMPSNTGIVRLKLETVT